MGIQGLLQFIKDASEPINVKKYGGQIVAVDTYCWLHKGAFSCAEKLAKGEPTDQYVSYCMKFVDMLLSFGVKPILVFDGRNLPSKQEVEKSRRERRQSNLQKGKQLLREGKISEARECFTRSVNITPSMAHDVIKTARMRGVDCVVAPYEADAQLAFLNKSGIAQAVITEDSDLLAFGCKKVILKMDKQGNGLEIDQCHLGRCKSLGNIFTEERFRYMCILSGCDYLPSLYGIGLGKACKLLRMANNPDILKVIKKMGQYLKMDITVPDEYIEGFTKANNTFLYQLVFDPLKRKVVPLNPYPDHIDPASLSYAGTNVGDERGLEMALGNLDINTMQRIDDFNPDAHYTQPTKAARSSSWNDRCDKSGPLQMSIWSKNYKPCSTQPKSPTTPKRQTLTLGKERIVSVQSLKLPQKESQVKRPCEDTSLSVDDLLGQYSAGVKRRCSETPPSTETLTNNNIVSKEKGQHSGSTVGQSQPRNRFATLLQLRNQLEEGTGEQATCSRFFCHGESNMADTQEESLKQDLPQTGGSTPASCQYPDSEREQAKDESSSPPASPAHSARPASLGLGVFSWSGSTRELTTTDRHQSSTPSGLSTLQQFHRKKGSFSWAGSGLSLLSSPVEGSEDAEKSPRSPPSQDSAYFSQSSSTSAGVEDSLVTEDNSDKEKERDSDGSNCPSSSPTDKLKPALNRTKVSGLSRKRPCGQGKGSKIETSAPARPSGLRKKASGKKSTVNNENNPGQQATISGLWGAFSFKKDNLKLNACKKGKPLSPVRENVMTTD
ncbi:exonuclease 1-like [Sinocyclocheilus grahami]|uniref:Exonuclease 1 n=1 Tax=Sinocyclocheilus grahami TaxID=75366 RepID=A0A672JSG1_SINGR|nr:PREDICTED: exonuclease 1-like [Sinocyclocheilus grahami]XP_016091861.1 PREDICTED: exonuclease 1-like [Sinocyclocheilus grahami]XP_016091871.1 PREDICTED: exonuclease 1-like [Sinocyclocheilus grahami]XP_016091879.1 PREDICTED: exonuclease 1-like [Sinocyclocheilus grahami]